MLDIEILEVKKNDVSLESKIKSITNLPLTMFIFFHYMDKDIQADHDFIKSIEDKYKININWIDLSKIVNEHKNVITKFDLKISEQFVIDMIQNNIRDSIMDILLRSTNFYSKY